MTTSFAPLKVRQRLGRGAWAAPRPFGDDGWSYASKAEHGHVIITCADHPDYDAEVVHASMAFADRDPTYLEMAHLHQAVWPNGYAYMAFVPSAFHVNIHQHALHIWGRLDGKPMMPEMSGLAPFGRTI